MYSIIELQTNGATTAHVYQSAETKEDAMSKFHLVMAAAALSTVEIHTCLVVDEQGKYLARECYEHRAEEPPQEGEE